jgi:SAM-dependent methyltransferase
MLEAVQTLLDRLRDAEAGGRLVKLTLGTPRGTDPTLRNVFVRPVQLRAGRRLAFVFRHATRDLTRNLALDEALARLADLLGRDFGSAHLFTTDSETELQWPADAPPRLRTGPARHAGPADPRHDRVKQHRVAPESAPWLRSLGVTGADGRVRDGMAPKYRQIQKFVEILEHGVAGLALRPDRTLRLVDMGCGKGYLTFAACDWLRRAGWQAEVRGIEARPELVELCNRAAREHGLTGLQFESGTIASAALEAVDILVALHACDTATDDALARGIEAGAALIFAAPCCHRELRPQLRPPGVLAGALRHGILCERQAEFVTDALRAGLLEWAGYDTKVFEFIATEHTAKNLMIAATRRLQAVRGEERAGPVRSLAAFFGIRSQHLATVLGFELTPPAAAATAGTV